jgi:acetyltransferase-like isoleucine patch superfamily enzyme
MKIVFVVYSCKSYKPYTINNNFELDSDFPSNYSLKIFGKSIITRNLDILNSLFDIEKIILSKDLDFLGSIIDKTYSFDIEVEEIENEDTIELEVINSSDIINGKYNQYFNSTEETINRYPKPIQSIDLSNKKIFYLPCNIILSKNSSKEKIKFMLFRSPWEFLEAVNELLQHEIKDTVISEKANIAKSSVIQGPCIIEDDVVVDDFVKIKGPVFIGSGSYIGMGSLIRNSVLENNTNIGFNCEIGKSYFAGTSKISHHNVILDSLIGKNVWFGGYSGTANVLLTRENIKYRIDGKLVDTGKTHFGAVVSNNSSIGASVIILPGRKVPPNTIIQAGTIFKQ